MISELLLVIPANLLNIMSVSALGDVLCGCVIFLSCSHSAAAACSSLNRPLKGWDGGTEGGGGGVLCGCQSYMPACFWLTCSLYVETNSSTSAAGLHLSLAILQSVTCFLHFFCHGGSAQVFTVCPSWIDIDSLRCSAFSIKVFQKQECYKNVTFSFKHQFKADVINSAATWHDPSQLGESQGCNLLYKAKRQASSNQRFSEV